MDEWEAFVPLLILGTLAAVVIAVVALARLGSLQRRLDAVDSDLQRLRGQFAGAMTAARTAAAIATPAPAPDEPTAALVQTPSVESAGTSPPEQQAAPGQPWFTPSPAATAPLSPIVADGPALEPIAAATPAAAGGRGRSALEFRLGGGLFVWVGGVALALSGLFLVRYAIDHGVLSPLVRVLLGVVFGGAAIGGAEWLRLRDDRVAQALAAAGVAALYGALLSAVTLYGLIPKFAGGLLAFALTAGAISLALRHGVFVAALGLVGGVISPMVIGSETPNIPMLLGYLLAITAGTLAVIRHRGWWWLGWGVLAGDTLWSLAWIGMRAWEPAKHAGDLIWFGLFQVAVAGLFLWATWRRVREQGETLDLVKIKVWVAIIATGLLIFGGIAGAQTQWAGWLALALHGAGIYALARFVPHYQWLAVVPPVLSLLCFLAWRGARWLDIDQPESASFAATISIMGGLLAGGAWALLWNAGRPGFWAALSVAAALLHFLLAYAALRGIMPDAGWGALSLVLALPYLIASERLVRWRTIMPGATEALGFVAVGVVMFVAAAVPLELQRQWITVAYALALPLVAWIAWKLDLKVLRGVCWVLVSVVAVRLVVNPSILDYPLGTIPFVNWILYTYGIAAVCFWFAGRFLAHQTRDLLSVIVQSCVVLFVFLLLTLEIRSLFNADKLAGDRMLFFERSTYVAAWGALALALLYYDSIAPSAVRNWAWRIVGSLALFTAVVVQGLVFNPALIADKVGRLPIFNGLLLAFAVPAALAAAASLRLARSNDVTARTVAAGSAVLLAFIWLTTEIRHLFHPEFGGDPFAARGAELYLYSAGWLLFGTVVLGVGMWRHLPAARHAGMAVVLLAICKAFLVDTAGLEDLWRVLSFFGLGAVLLALGFFYRRIAFATAAGGPPSSPA